MANMATTQQDTEIRVVPPVDVYESEKDYLLVVDIPGLDSAAIDVEVDKDVVKLVAKRSDATEAIRYQREFRVPSGVDAQAVTAVSRDGVLRLVLPKLATAQPRKIAVAH